MGHKGTQEIPPPPSPSMKEENKSIKKQKHALHVCTHKHTECMVQFDRRVEPGKIINTHIPSPIQQSQKESLDQISLWPLPKKI